MALEEAKKEERWFVLLYFYSNPQNRKVKPEIFEYVFEESIKRKKWLELLYFYSNPQNRKVKPEIFGLVLEEVIKRKKWSELLYFYSNPENQKVKPEIFEYVLEEARKRKKWSELLEFYSNPENQKIRPDILELALEEIKKENGWLILLKFYSNPENQKIKPELFELTLEKVKNENRWYSLLEFYSNPENQKIRPDILEFALEKAIRERKWGALIIFYSNPKNRETNYPNLGASFHKSIQRIPDKNLRIEVASLYQKFLKNPRAPIALYLLSSPDNLPILITSWHLGLIPEVVLSWSLNDDENNTILPSMVNLVKSEVKFDFPFIFYPRENLRKYNEFLIKYFQKLSFIKSLPDELTQNIIEIHLQNLKRIIEEYQITQETLSLPLGLLRKIVEELKDFEKNIILKFKEIFSLPPEINDQEILILLEECQYINVLLTLRGHYQKTYPQGLPLLNKIVASLIKNTFIEERYNLKDPVVQKQLFSLIKSFPSLKQQERIISLWRGNCFTISISRIKTEKRKETFSFAGIIEHLRTQVIESEHYKDILDIILDVVKSSSREKKEIEVKIKEQISLALNGKTMNILEIRKLLENKITKEKINIIVGIMQIFQDLARNKPINDLLGSLKRLEKNVNQYWPELKEKVIWETDIIRYLKPQLEKFTEKEKTLFETTLQLTYLTDHPRTLFEIGAYPISTCQDYRSTDVQNNNLLGYVFDSHIRALVKRNVYLETEIDLKEEILKTAKIELDENREEIIITLPSQEIIKGKLSKPIARRIVFLGEKNNNPVLLLEPIYTEAGRINEDDQKLNEPVYKLQKALAERGINLEITTSSFNVNIPPSRNPASYYRDI